MKYYVYAYLDSRLEENISFGDIFFTHRPIYIGKGKNNRMLDHFKDRKRFKTYFYNKLNKMILEENTPMVIKLKEFDNEQDAIKMEVDLIRFLGKKKNGGLLYNITDGGNGVSGYVYTDEQKEERRMISIKINSKQYFPDNRGKNHPMFGRKHKQSSIDKMIEIRTGTKQSKEWIEKRAAKLRGIPLSQEHKDKLAESNRGKIVSEETKLKISKSKIGCIPHNKGKIKDIILQIDSNGIIVKEWNNLNELIDYGFQKSNVINVCTGIKNTHLGFGWIYKKDYREGFIPKHNVKIIKDIILQIDIEGNIIKEWETLSELTDAGYINSCILSVCRNKLKSHGGFIWKYKSDFI